MIAFVSVEIPQGKGNTYNRYNHEQHSLPAEYAERRSAVFHMCKLEEFPYDGNGFSHKHIGPDGRFGNLIQSDQQDTKKVISHTNYGTTCVPPPRLMSISFWSLSNPLLPWSCPVHHC